MFKLSVVVLAIALAQVLAAPAPLSPSLKHILATKGTADIMVSMADKTFSTLHRIKATRYASRSARLNAVASSLKAIAEKSQKGVLAYLATQSVKVKPLWISNKIAIKGASAELVAVLSAMPEVESVSEDAVIPLHVPVSSSPAKPLELQWGVDLIEAPAVWAQGFTGKGIVVSTIDTGARYTHKNLYANYRQDHGWFDPYYGSSMPSDDQGHGTHTVGTIAGLDGIGVAPEAKWIACLGCDFDGCTTSALEECGQFITCPTNPDGTGEQCDLAPHLVSNSWGGSGGQDFYDEVIAAWGAAGIVPIFSNGNSGSSCYSAGSPADSRYTPVIAVGATDEDDELAYFSSVGPSAFDEIKPDISAPGVDIISSSSSADDAFESMSGTSMACPHTSGVVALLLSADPSLDYDGITDALYGGATHSVGTTGSNCGGINESEYPNNHVGWGRLSASASVSRVLKNLH